MRPTHLLLIGAVAVAGYLLGPQIKARVLPLLTGFTGLSMRLDPGASESSIDDRRRGGGGGLTRTGFPGGEEGGGFPGGPDGRHRDGGGMPPWARGGGAPWDEARRGGEGPGGDFRPGGGRGGDGQGRPYRRWRDCVPGPRGRMQCGPWNDGPEPNDGGR